MPAKKQSYWEFILIDAGPDCKSMGAFAVGDIDDDGRSEMVVGSDKNISWYRHDSPVKGVIGEGSVHCGTLVDDIDGDGKNEVAAGMTIDGVDKIVWFKNIGGAWKRFVVDDKTTGHVHDLLCVDIDGDGEKELIANAAYCPVWGVFIYKRGSDITQPWHKAVVQTGTSEEGLAIADLDGDGRNEIISGPSYYHCESSDLMAGPWTRIHYAPNFRELVRVAALDITGNGSPDILITDSEYPDGRFSWFENRRKGKAWVEHEIMRGIYFGHSLQAWRDAATGASKVFLAEMNAGWDMPMNPKSRIMLFSSTSKGRRWDIETMDSGQGTHLALMYDIDNDGELEVVGKEWGLRYHLPRVHYWKRRDQTPAYARFKHHFIDYDKPYRAIDMIAADVDGDGKEDVVCGAWWYKSPSWRRYDIPGIHQIIAAYDIDGDGRMEFVGTKAREGANREYDALTSELVWIKAVNPVKGLWRAYPIGTGVGDWPHGNLIGRFLPNGALALMTSYHSSHAQNQPHYPELFEAPADPRQGPWMKRTAAQLAYGEELLAADFDGDGVMEIAAGTHILKYDGQGAYKAISMGADDFYAARLALMDVNGDGRMDVVMGEEVLDFKNMVAPYSRLVWFENPGVLDGRPWNMHVIDKVKCGHSVGAADLDGDGELEVICGEHDIVNPYRNRSRLMIYKKAEPTGRMWKRSVIDDRFEHHDGTKTIKLPSGRTGIISHGWNDQRWVHLWEPY